ncbi:hypothetical protein [Hymenobacter sp. B81]|uniref:hypothetical protein n=1 Tax=Hymenobacter sp. B81 TaxID=3344878 RepID=UPI0037DCC1D9
MKELGLGLLLVGVISLILPLLNLNFLFLDWINNWGPATAWLIRGGITLLGLVLWLSFRNRD